MDYREVVVRILVERALDIARLFYSGLHTYEEASSKPTHPPSYWTVVIVLLEEVSTVLIERPEGRHGSEDVVPF